MQITDILARMGGLQSMARELGVSETQAATGAEALIPAILGGFKRQAPSHPTGMDGLGGLLGQFLWHSVSHPDRRNRPQLFDRDADLQNASNRRHSPSNRLL